MPCSSSSFPILHIELWIILPSARALTYHRVIPAAESVTYHKPIEVTVPHATPKVIRYTRIVRINVNPYRIGAAYAYSVDVRNSTRRLITGSPRSDLIMETQRNNTVLPERFISVLQWRQSYSRFYDIFLRHSD